MEPHEGDGSRRDSKMLAKGRHGRYKLRTEFTQGTYVVNWQALVEQVRKYGILDIGTAFLLGGTTRFIKSCSLVYSLAKWWHDTHGQTVLTGTMDIVGGYLTHGVTSVVLYSM